MDPAWAEKGLTPRWLEENCVIGGFNCQETGCGYTNCTIFRPDLLDEETLRKKYMVSGNAPRRDYTLRS
jgi:hypothetical protein